MKSGSVYELLLKNRRDIPDHLTPPTILDGYASWVEAFWELSTDRNIMGDRPGPIPSRSIREYSQGWEPETRELFRKALRAMDREFLGQASPAPQVVEAAEPEAPTSDNPARDNFRAMFKR